MATLTAAQVAALVIKVGFPVDTRVTMVAIARAESGFRVEALNPSSASGLFQILWRVHRQYDQRQLLSDPEYNTRAAFDIYRSQGLRAWTVFTSGAYLKHVAEARQGVAQAASITGSAVLPGAGAGSSGGVTYGPLGSQLVSAGAGGPLAAAREVSPLQPLRIIGATMWAEVSRLVLGAPTFEAGIETVPHLKFTLADPGGNLLRTLPVFTQGARVQYVDLNMRIDQVVFEPGTHGTGQIVITAIDDIAYALTKLTGPATASDISATWWLAAELQRAGLNPGDCLLGEATLTQSQISRDVADQQGSVGAGQAPSGWTTMTRLARELGKRFFISGTRVVFASSAFAMRWCAAGSLRLTYAGPLVEGEKWLTLPSTTLATVGERSDVLQVTGRVPLNRALFFRPGVSVVVRNTPSLIGDSWVEMMCAHVSYGLGTDVDGAEITLMQPVDPPPQPPAAPNPNGGDTSAGTTTSGGGADGQIDRFVAIALQQAGKRYVFGAEAAPSNPDPRAFDCCLTADSMIATSMRGPLPIAEVRPGDLVWCWDGGALGERKVVATLEQPVQPIFAVKTRTSTVRASANHPFLVLRKAPRDRNSQGGWLPVHWSPTWIRTDQLARGDLLVSLERAPAATQHVALPDGTPVDTDVAWLLGEIVGDGHVTRSGVVIATFRKEIRNRIRSIAARVWDAQGVNHATHGLIISSAHLRNVLTELGMRVLGPEKRVPELLRALPPAPLRAFLAGYAEADGHYDKRGHQTYSSCSRRLIDEVRALHRLLGDRVSNVTTAPRNKSITIRGRVVKNVLPLHSFAVYPDSIRRNNTVLNTYGARRALPDRAFTVERVSSITPDGSEITFDLEIEGARNYIADGLVVHNSELVEWAAARAGISPRVPDGSANQLAHCRARSTLVSVQAGINTKGALLFMPGHVAISLGNGKTIEAMNPSQGVRQGNASGRRWTAAGKIPGAQGYR